MLKMAEAKKSLFSKQILSLDKSIYISIKKTKKMKKIFLITLSAFFAFSSCNDSQTKERVISSSQDEVITQVDLTSGEKITNLTSTVDGSLISLCVYSKENDTTHVRVYSGRIFVERKKLQLQQHVVLIEH